MCMVGLILSNKRKSSSLIKRFLTKQTRGGFHLRGERKPHLLKGGPWDDKSSDL